MNHLPLIIKREYLTKVRNKSFIIMTFLSPLIMIGLGTLIFYLTQLNSNKERTISILDETGKVAEIFTNDEDSNTKYIILTGITLDEAKKQVEETEEYGLLHIEKKESIEDISTHIKFYSEDSPSVTFISRLEQKLSKKLTGEAFINNGVDISLVNKSKMDVTIVQESFTGERSSKYINYSKLGFGLTAGYLLFMFIIIYGNMIMRSVIEEKTNRIIEVIISSVKPVQLLMGKIIGTSLAGVTQFIMWVALGGIGILIFSVVFGVDLMGAQAQVMEQQALMTEAGDISTQVKIAEIFQSLPLANLVIAFFVFFIGGYLLYSSLYAAIGAAVDNETDTQQFIKFEIKDNGIGISDEMQENIFDSFSQGSVQINRKYGGTGLGLTIVKSLLELLESDIQLKSKLGEGSTFHFSLTFDKIPVETIETEAINEEKTDLKSRKFKVLLVEDNKINQVITKKIIAKQNMTCDIADDGYQAIDYARSNRYDFILMDIHMPGISGVEATKEIRKFDVSTPIIALTAISLDDNKADFLKDGFNEVISKPFDPEIFYQKISHILS